MTDPALSPTQPQPVDTFNLFAVGLQAERIRVILLQRLVSGLTADEAFNLAAYLVVMAELLEPIWSFDQVLAAVRAT
jgi:hypothetical protein